MTGMNHCPLPGWEGAESGPSQKTCLYRIIINSCFRVKSGEDKALDYLSLLIFRKQSPKNIFNMKRIFVVAALFTCSQLHAQDSAQLLDPVSVTANKMPQKQSATGKVVTVITKEQIDQARGRTLGQLLNEQAGITINGALNNLGSNQTLYVRGAASGRTLVLVDGVPVYDPSLINSEFDLNLIALANVDRIEILRGAQSTLYGSDAIAGVINIISSPNSNKPVSLNASLSAGDYGTFRGNAQLTGKTGKLTYSARYAHLQTKGFSSAYDSARKGFERDGYNSDVMQASALYQFTPELSVRGFIQNSRYKTDLDASAFTDEKDYTSNNKGLMAGGSIYYKKNNISLTGNYQYSDVNRNYFNDSTDVPGFSKFVTDDYYGRNQFAELYSSIGLSKNFTLLHGADYRYSDMHSEYYSLSAFGPYSSRFKDTAQSQASLYASLLYHGLNDRLAIEAGGRLNVHSRYGSNQTYTINPSFAIDNHFRLFASLATGFKAPTLYHLYSSSGNLMLKPEQSKTWEAGLQQQHGSFQNRIVFFKRSIDNGIDFNYITYTYFNFIHQDVKGLEWEMKAALLKGLTISSNYTYLKSIEQSQSRVNFKDTTYSYLLRRPSHQLNITLAYRFANSLSVSLSSHSVSERRDFGGYQKADVLLKGYTIFNAHAAYKFEKGLSLFADVQNLTNKTFFDTWGYNAIPSLISGGVSISL
jgi:vitamin B12 transporter